MSTKTAVEFRSRVGGKCLIAAGEVALRRGKERSMGEKVDEAKGRAKEAAGDLTDDRSLKNEGRVDRASGTVKEKVGGVADKLKRAIRRGDR